MTIIWDWNGTLLNDVQLCNDILNSMLKKHGYNEVGDINAYRNVFCFPIIKYYEDAGFNFSKHSFEVLANEFMTKFEKESKLCHLQKNAQEILKFAKQNKIKQVILSASPIDVLTKQVKWLGVTEYFDEILGLNDVYAKSKIELAQNFMSKSNENPDDFILVGDTEHDYEVACALNIKKCILCNKGHQTNETLLKTGAEIIDDLIELKYYLK